MARNIDQIIEDTEADEVAAVRKAKGGKTLAFVRNIESQAIRRVKKELVAGTHLPDTPDPVKPKAAVKVKAKAKAKKKTKE